MKKNKTDFLLILLILLVPALCSVVHADSETATFTNRNSSYYFYSEGCGTTYASAIGGTTYTTQGTNPTSTSRVVRSYLRVSNPVTGYSNTMSKAVVIRQSGVCSVSLERGLTASDTMVHSVTKYNSTNATGYASASKTDDIMILVTNNFQ